ncbi:MAG: hypothetical protein M0P73_08645 [Syntrophobacterales bacterium]|jgi:hypothetical protein|nr:hypothetical protein [Syntrophobacterales bacterium]
MIYVLYFSDGGSPKTGLTPAITVYKKVGDGSDATSPPTITEIGGGFYKFTATPPEALVVRVDGGSVLADPYRYKVMQLTPNDASLDAAVSTRAPESGGNVAAIKARTDNLPSDPASESNVQGHAADALAAYDPPTKAELDAAVAPLALEAGLEVHVLAVLNSYDPPTRDEAMADKTAVLAAIAALNDLTIGEILGGDLSDSLSFRANSLADLVRKLFWVICNRLVINDASGAFTAYKTDGVTPAAQGSNTDNGVSTERSEPTWL